MYMSMFSGSINKYGECVVSFKEVYQSLCAGIADFFEDAVLNDITTESWKEPDGPLECADFKLSGTRIFYLQYKGEGDVAYTRLRPADTPISYIFQRCDSHMEGKLLEFLLNSFQIAALARYQGEVIRDIPVRDL